MPKVLAVNGGAAIPHTARVAPAIGFARRAAHGLASAMATQHAPSAVGGRSARWQPSSNTTPQEGAGRRAIIGL